MMFTYGRQPVPLFVEPCAGALGVALALAGSRAPCGWMGGKSGYADAILQTMGLRRGQGLEELHKRREDVLLRDALERGHGLGGAHRREHAAVELDVVLVVAAQEVHVARGRGEEPHGSPQDAD